LGYFTPILSKPDLLDWAFFTSKSNWAIPKDWLTV
jgi:hypothetical protein